MTNNIYAQIILTTKEKINIELYKDIAPITVDNFVKLAKQGQFKGNIFHRVIKDFMIQTGGYVIDDSYSLCEANKVDSIYGEFSQNGWDKNNLSHTLGVISMARTSDVNSASSQFFICSATCPWLDGAYAAFGKTMDDESNDVVLKISNVKTCAPHPAFSDFPVDVIEIEDVIISDTPFK